MTMGFPGLSKTGLTLSFAAAVLFGFSMHVHAQSDNTLSAKTPTPMTAADPGIPIEHLALLVKPLTREELEVEAKAWRDLLKAKVAEIALRQIEVKKHKKVTEDAAKLIEQKAEQQNKVVAPQHDAEAAKKRRQQLAESLPQLKEEEFALTKRFTMVLDALETKGGDVESYRKYITAVSGLALDMSDAETTWTVIKGWLTSEQGGQRWLWNVVEFILILVAFYFAGSIVSGLIRRGASRIPDASQLLISFLSKFVKQAIMVIGLMVALAALEVNIGPLLAAVGAAGFVIAFALQNTLSNFASGLLILAYRPFDVGHVIEAAGISGVVDSVSLFSTHVRTFDNKVMIVPNNDIWGGTITNATASNTRRVDMVFGIGYDDDIEKAKEILETLLREHELVLDDPAPVVQMHELADSSINFICRPWTKTGDYWTVYWNITRAVKREFDRCGISIPYPQRDVHIHQDTSTTSE